MPYRLVLLTTLLTFGCGSSGENGSDAAVTDASAVDGAAAVVVDALVADAPPNTCTIHDTIQSCGANCGMCMASGDREIPTCDGTQCGISCKASAPKCSDGSCSRLIFNFDSNTLEGAVAVAPAGQSIAVRNNLGNLAIAMEVTNLTEIRFRVPVCLTGSVDLTPKTLSARVMFEGGNATGLQYFVQASLPSPRTGAFLGQKEVASGGYVTLSFPLLMSQFSNTTTDVTFQAGTLGAQFSGTIWFDDIKIE